MGGQYQARIGIRWRLNIPNDWSAKLKLACVTKGNEITLSGTKKPSISNKIFFKGGSATYERW